MGEKQINNRHKETNSINRSLLNRVWNGFFVLVFALSLIGVQPIQSVYADAASVRVSQGSDDAEESVANGEVDLTSSDLELINDSGFGGPGDQIVGIRFQGVSVPHGATIQSAYIEFETDETSTTETHLTIFGQAADNSDTFVNATNDISTRPRTSASASWSPDAWNTTSEKHQTSDLSLILQEIVNRSGWSEGNAVVFLFEGSGSRVAEAYEGESANAPLLVIDYVVSIDPIINTSGTLEAFSSEPGEYSDIQSYSVSGVNLEGDITITPPVDFEISLTGVDGWIANPSTIVLSPDGGGAIAETDIYVRFYRSAEGTTSVNITHTSTSAAQVDVGVTGTASIPLGGWVAYNDCAWASGQLDTNITLYTIPSGGTASGLLVDYTTGEDTPVTATITSSGSPTIQTGTYGGSETDAGTDAYEAFHGIVDMPGVVQYGGSSGWWVEVSFTDLDPDSTYAFVTSANRDGDYTDRFTKFTLLDAATATNTSSSGVTISTTTFADDTTVFNTGENTLEGYVASWEEIDPGEDGDFSVRAECDSSSSSYKAYAFSVFKLAEEAPVGPRIMTSVDSLSAFSAAPGQLSSVQTYTVSGENLTEDINIAAPSGFLLSLDDYEYNTFLTLTQTDGIVADTTVYVALYSDTEGVFDGDIIHSSAGAVSKPVAVSGEVSSTFETSFQQDIDGYTGTEDTFVMENNPNTAYGDEAWVEWDADEPYGSGKVNTGLLKFDDIFGTGAGQIPLGATILDATLTITINDTGDEAAVNEVISAWSEATTFNSFGSTAGVQAEDYGDATGTASGASTGTYSMDVTESVQGWSDGENNLGWIFRPLGNGGVEFRSSEYTTVSERPLLEVTYYVGEVNDPPNTPNLVQPADDAFDVSIPPTLEVTISDPESDLMDVSFYGRPVGTGSGEDFLFIAIPDTQMLAQSYPSVMLSQFQWIASQTMAFVTSLGDIVNSSSTISQWDAADSAYDELDSAEKAYSVGPGNHDIAYGTTYYPDYFGSARFTGKPSYQGYYTGGGDNYNNYSFFSASGMDFIVINLQYNAPTAQQEWADSLLKAYPERQGIVVQHDILNTNNSWANQATFNSLKDNPNLFLMLCGHMHSGSDGSAYRSELGDDGHTIHILLTDYQDLSNSDNLRLLTFKPAEDAIFAQIYSPGGDSYLTNASNYEEFTMAYEMSGSEPFELIGTVEDMGDGNVSISWSGLANETEYEWYVEVSDGTSTTVSSTWSFTTRAANNPPVVSDIPDQSVAEGGSFATINLDDYVEDVEDIDSDISWTYGGNSDLTVSIVDRVATIGIPSAEWAGEETITFTAEDLDGATDSDSATFTVTPVNDPPVVDDIPNQTIVEGDSFTTINLDIYVEDTEDADSDISWTFTGNVEMIVNIADRVATISVPNADWNGIETITFTAEDLDGGTDDDSATFTVTAVNDAPVVSDIPDQTIAEGESFATINLDDFVSDVDNPDTEISWTTSGEVDLTVNIVDRVATISVPNADWNGTETITFTATDLGLATDSDSATFTVTSVNDAPVVDDMPGETIVEGGSFATINLDDYVSDVDNPDTEISWTASGNVELTVNIVDRVATITVPSADWNGTETITFTATDLGLATDSDSAIFTVTAVNDAPVVSDIPDQTIAEGESFATINLDNFVSDVDNPDTEISWTTSGEVELTVNIVGRVATITVPNADWNGTETITFTATDLGLATDSDSATFTVTAINDAPVVSDIPDQTIAEGESFATINLDDYVSDVDNPDTEISWTASGEVELTVSIVGRVATITVPSSEWNGSETITFTATDLGLATDSDSATFTVTPVNAAPVLTYIGDKEVDELVELAFTATATDSDIPEQPLTFSLEDGTGDVPTGATITSGGAFSWTPTEAQGAGEYTFDICVSDGYADDCETITVTVSEINESPVLGVIGNKEVDEETALTFTATATDADLPEQPLAFNLKGAVPAGAAITTGGAFSWTPSETQGGDEYTFDICVSDGELEDCETITVTVAEINEAPVLGTIGNKEVDEEIALTFTATATDADLPEQALTFNLEGEVPAGASITSGGAFSWTPTEAQGVGEYTFDVCVSDGDLDDCETITVTVDETNEAPILGAIGDKEIDEEASLTFTATATDTDLPEQTLVFSLEGSVPTGASITSGGAFSWTPTEAQGAGEYTFDVCVSDSELDDCETIAVTVVEINEAPVLGAIGDKEINEEAALTFTATATDADLPEQTLTFSLEGSVPTGASITGGGAFSWTPSEAQGGEEYTFDICVSDSELDDCETITVTVAEINEAPVLGTIGDKEVDEQVALTFTATATDADLPEQTLVFSLEAGTAGVVPAGASITSGGAFSWTPTEAQGAGEYTFDVCVSDGELDDCETITVTVAEINEAPVLGAIGDKEIDEEEELTFTATASDTDLPAQALTFGLKDGLTGEIPAGASITFGGVFSWTPTEAQGAGAYTFDVCVSDGYADDCETITVTVSEINEAPVLGAIGDKEIDEEAALTFTATATDADLPEQTLVFSLKAGLEGVVPAGASITSGGAFSWTPTEEQGVGEYTFDVCVSDGELEDCETITVTVAEINEAPVLGAIGDKEVDEEVALTFTATATDADLPEQTLVFSLEGSVPTGASITGGGAFSWTPTEEQGAGEYTFDVCVSDGDLDDCETITITVAEINEAPVLGMIGDKEADEQVALTFTATATDADLPIQTLTFSLSDGTAGDIPAGASITAGGAFSWTPTEAQGPDDYTFDICVSDGELNDCETITVTVNEVNLAPVLGAIGNKDIDEGVLLSFTATATDLDFPVQDLMFYLDDGASGEVPDGAVMESTGGFSWIPAENQGSQAFIFDVCVSDGIKADCETITVTVNEVNTAPELDAIGDKGVEDGSTLAFTATANDPDLPVQSLTFTLEDGLTGEVPSGASITIGGAFSWTPTEEQAPGDYTFDICVSDGALKDCETITVSVSEYEPKACYVLTISHTGDGSDPVPDIANSEGCSAGEYEPGETITLSSAIPDDGWHIASWYGTQDDGSTGDSNVIVMPEGETEVGVDYETYIFMPMFLGPNN